MALIYIVEDDQNIREIESFALKNSGYQIRDFSNAAEFYQAMKVIRPDLVLLDIMLPEEDGMEILQKLRKNPDTRRLPVIMVTAKSTELDRVKGLDGGADDYIVKPFGVMELISRVKAVLRRSGSHAPGEVEVISGNIRMNMEKHRVYVDETGVELTYKEFELLRVFLNNAGNVMTRELLMDRVWGTTYEGESRTLDMHIKTLRQKLGAAGERIRTVRNVGYRLE